MTVTLPAELEAQIQRKVDAGAAPSVDAFVERALREALTLGATPSEEESSQASYAEGYLLSAKAALADAERSPVRRKPMSEIIGEIWGDLPDKAFSDLPVDGAEQHDHYIYGTPKREL